MTFFLETYKVLVRNLITQHQAVLGERKTQFKSLAARILIQTRSLSCQILIEHQKGIIGNKLQTDRMPWLQFEHNGTREPRRTVRKWRSHGTAGPRK